jgi:hypothetical protein
MFYSQNAHQNRQEMAKRNQIILGMDIAIQIWLIQIFIFIVKLSLSIGLALKLK